MIPAYVISRVVDKARRDHISKSIPKSIGWSFLDATDGHKPEEIPEKYLKLLRPRFWYSDHLKPGAVGCFISHYRAWERVLETRQSSLILEDDVVFSDKPLPLTAAQSAKFDVIFFNKRTANWFSLYEDLVGPSIDPINSLEEIVKSITATNEAPPYPKASGGDCYFINPEGAQRLIEHADHVGIRLGVDWFMVGAGLLGAGCKRGNWETPSQAAEIMNSSVAGKIPTGIARDWIAAAKPGGIEGSSISHRTRVSCIEYISRLPVPAVDEKEQGQGRGI